MLIDAEYNAENLTNQTGNAPHINASNQWYSNSSSANSGVKVPNITGQVIASFNLNVSYTGNTGSTANESNKTQYFLVQINSGQPSGTYSGFLYITADANQ